MQILRTTHELSAYLRNNDCKLGCFADTSFLYGMAYDDDRLFAKANDVHDLLAENAVPIYANVISRMEFVDLILRKQITNLFLKSSLPLLITGDSDFESCFEGSQSMSDKAIFIL